MSKFSNIFKILSKITIICLYSYLKFLKIFSKKLFLIFQNFLKIILKILKIFLQFIENVLKIF